MKRTIFLWICCPLALISFSGCNKNDDPQPQPVPEFGRFVKKLQVSENDYQLFEYGPEKEVTFYRSQWQSSADGNISRIDYHFNHTNGQLESLRTAVSRTVYSYSDGRLQTAENFNKNDKKISTHTFAYDGSGRLASLTESISEPDEITATRMRYTYHPDGNLEKIEFGSLKVGEENFIPDYTKLFEAYDNHPQTIPSAVWEHFIPGLVLQHNNPVRIKNIDKNGDVTDILHLAYQYDEAGYPKQRDQHFERNGQQQPGITYQYFY